MSSDWQFEHAFDAARAQRLAAFDKFAKVEAVIAASATVQGAWICEAASLGAKDCFRPSVSLAVSGEVFDAFFNSPGGYRAQYLSSPEDGQAANGRLLRVLEPRLTAAVLEDCGTERLSSASVRNAFLANSAKVWIAEHELDFLQMTRDLAVSAWNRE